MEPNDKEFRRNLLEQMVPEPGRLERYRQEMTKMLDNNERGLRLEKRITIVLWLFGVAMMTAFLLMSGFYHPTPERTWMVMLALYAVILFYGGLEIIKHFINRSRVEVLKELKQLELHVLELDERLRQKA